MNRFFTILALVAIMPLCHAQTEDPKGVYKMTGVVGKNGVINNSMDQYKVCTDSITLTVFFRSKSSFSIVDNDKQVLKYTGKEPDAEHPDKIRIFDSNAERFTLQWFNKSFTNHMVFSEDDWVTEYYASDEYSESGKVLFDAITNPAPAYDKANPLYGHWHIYNEQFDEIPDAKKFLKENKNFSYSYTGNDICIITPSHFIYCGGQISDCKSDGKSYFDINSKWDIHWLSKDILLVARRRNRITDYELWTRITDDVTPLNRKASKIMNNKKK